MTVLEAGAGLAGRTPRTCDRCDAVWLVAEDGPCGLCGTGTLREGSARVDGDPELAVPFGIDAERAAAAVAEHVDRAVLPVSDARVAADRVVAHYVPVWLVDARLRAGWEAEVGFDYTVQSTVEKVRGGQWTSVPVEETRVRWEPRAGTLERWFDNEPAAALERWEAWADVLSPPVARGGRTPRPSVPILVPDRPPSDAWPAAEAGLKRRAGADLARATQAQHTREVFLDAAWDDTRWTWLLLPAYSTWYRDHAGNVRVLVIDGVTGRVTGPIAASPAKASARAGMWVTGGLGVLGVSVLVALPGIVLWPLLLLTALGAVLGFALLLAAVGPLLRARGINGALPSTDPLTGRAVSP